MSDAYTVVGYSCNNDCTHCFNSAVIEQLRTEKLPVDRSTPELKRLIIDIKNKGFDSITLTGGEPTIRRDFFGILKFAGSKGLKVCVQTNGRRFCSGRFVDRMLRIVPDASFTIPLHHTRPQVHDRITRVKGSFDETVGGLKNLVSRGVGKRILVNVVMTRYNYRNLAGIADFTRRIGVGGLTLTFPQAGGRTLEYWRRIIPRYSEIKGYMLKAARIAKNGGMSLCITAVPFCFSGDYIADTRDIFYVKKWMDGEGLERNLIGRDEDILRDIVLSGRRKPLSCKKCRCFNVCEGAWEEYFRLYGTGEFRPVAGRRVETLGDLGRILAGARVK